MGPAEQRLRQFAIQSNQRYVPCRGNTSAPCVVVGEAPGADEEREGQPFVGASGSLLMKMLSEAGFQFNDFWITNAYKVRPPDNDLSRLNETGIPEDAFVDQFIEELYEFKPAIIIVAGATALGILCPDTIDKKSGSASISKWKGSLLQSNRLNWPHYVIPVTHPAYVLREWSERPIAVYCLAKAQEEMAYLLKNGKLNPLPSRQLLVAPSAPDLIDFMRECLASPNPIGDDIETIYGKYPYTSALALSPNLGTSFCFWDYSGTHAVQIWRLHDQILRTKRRVGQNYVGFDSHMYESLGFSPSVDLVDDTLVRHHVLWPEFPHKLQFLGMQYTREPYWKDEGKLWSPKEGKPRLMRYNALDSTCTLEIYNKQEEDFNDRPYLRGFYHDYEMRLDRALFHVENRGILVDTARLAKLREYVLRSIDKYCDETEQIVGRPTASIKECGPCQKVKKLKNCVCGQRTVKAIATARGIKQDDVFNIGSSSQLIEEFEKRGIKVPHKRGAKGVKGNKTVDEEALLRIALNNNQMKLPGIVIRVRELNKIRSTNVDAKLFEDTLFCSYGTTGTDTGRRNSTENIFGFGGNQQNIPKHTELGLRYRECLIARPGHIFVECDQKGAEDWIVQGIIVDNGGPRTGLEELLHGVNRHKKLAAFLFAMPENTIDKAGIHYYAGKKTRHAGNYGMQADRMSVVILVETGNNMPPAYTQWLLNKFHEFEPAIKGIFHKYVEDTLSATRTLRTPLGRERIFFDLRPGSNNSDTFRRAYAFIPQSTVGDNTGMSIVWLHDHGYRIVQDNHDAVTLEVRDTDEDIADALLALRESFNRKIVFPNGTTLTIPLEYMVGPNMREMIEVSGTFSRSKYLDQLAEQRKKRECQEPLVVTAG